MNAPETVTGPWVPIQHLFHLTSNCPFPVFFQFFFSFLQSNLSLSLQHSLCLVFNSFFQVELIESFLEIPTFGKKPNKCLLRGKARLKFQRKSFPGRRCQSGLQDCTAPFNPWLSCSWMMLWSIKERAPVHSGHGHQAAHTVLVLCATDVRWTAALGVALCFGHHTTYILWQPKILLTLFYVSWKNLCLLKYLFLGFKL